MRALSRFDLLWFVPGALLLAWLERQWPMLALAFFVLLTLTLGFAHGAMDIFLLRDARNRLNAKSCFAYALACAAFAAVLAPWPSVALIALLLLSVWHFGEEAHFEHAGQPVAWLLRAVQGGSSVMLPALLSPRELLPQVQAIAQDHASWVWPLWVGMAGLWFALLTAAFAIMKPWRADTAKTLWIELAVLIALNILLSPLMAFALFFGIYHSGAHILRMRQMHLREGKPWQDGLLAATVVLTWLGLAALLWWMGDQTFVRQDAALLLRWLVVALAAVTLPHLILIWRSRQRLFA